MEGPVPDKRHLGEAVWEIREEKEISRKDLAERSGIDTAHLNRAENHGRNFTWKTLGAVARALGVPISVVASRAELIAASGRPPKAPDDDR